VLVFVNDLEYYFLVDVNLIVITSASDCLERLISLMWLL